MWWLDVLIVFVIIAGIYAFVVMARAATNRLSSHTDRTAEQMYGEFADHREPSAASPVAAAAPGATPAKWC